ncbi:MAG: hypothetical protein WBE69_14510 [Candidatus Binataceae bacterium]|jgi:hypothetical protein
MRYDWPLLVNSHLTRQLFGGMLRRIVALHGAGGIRRAQSREISMTTLGAQGKVSAESFAKKATPGAACPPDAKGPSWGRWKHREIKTG